MKQGLNLTWWQVICICVIIGGGFSTTVYRVNAEQNEEINKKAGCEDVKRFVKYQEKINDKNDLKFKDVVDQMAALNVRFERIATQLEERTN